MWLLKRHSRGFYLCFVLLLALAVGGSALTYADSGTASTRIKGGSLTESHATNHVKLKLSKKMSMASYTLPITIKDARGSGKGWNLMITSTTFQLEDNNKYLPANASRIVGVSIACGAKSTCLSPVNSISYPLIVPAGVKPPTPVKFFDAALYSGMGRFQLTMMVNVNIPQNTQAGTYTSTLTLSIANGP